MRTTLRQWFEFGNVKLGFFIVAFLGFLYLTTWAWGKLRERKFRKLQRDYRFKEHEKTTEIDLFKDRLQEHEDHLFGINLFFQGISVLWDEKTVEINRYHFENIMKRGKDAISKAKQLLNEAQKNPNNINLLRQFEFPPFRGTPFLDDMTNRAKILVEAYDELFPGRPKENPLTTDEILRLMDKAVNRI